MDDSISDLERQFYKLSLDGSIGGSNHNHHTAQSSVTHPSPPVIVSVVGTGSQDLNPIDGGYVEILNQYTPQVQVGTGIVVQPDGRFEFTKQGVAVVTAYADVAHSANNSSVGATFTVTRGGTTIFSGRAVHARAPNAGDISNLSGVGSLEVLPGDILGVAFASDKTGDISIRASSLVAQLTDVEVVITEETFPYDLPMTFI